MKFKNSIKCFVFLFSILFSFSVSAYNSVNQLYKVKQSLTKKANIDVPVDDSAINESLLTEEVESGNDSENLLSESVYIPAFLQTILNIDFGGNNAPQCFNVPKTQGSLFLSIRVLRI